MSEKREDFQRWQSNYAEFLDDDSTKKISDYTRSLAVLTFEANKEKGKAPIISKHEGNIVFVDSNCTNLVSPNDTWLCRIDKSVYGQWSTATPLIKITLSEVLNYNEQLRNNLLDILWKRNNVELRRELVPILRSEIEARVRKEETERTEEKVRALENENDDLRDELDQVKIQLAKANERPSVPDYIELGSEEDGRCLDYSGMPITPESSGMPLTNQVPAIPYNGGYPTFICQTQKLADPSPRIRYEVIRIGRIALKSPSFSDDSRYFVHVSPDYKTMVIRPHPEGKVYCIGNIIELKGLDVISPFKEQKELLAEYSELYGGLLVHL